MEIVTQKKTLFWYNILKDQNGQTLMTSETYFSKSNAVRAGRFAAKRLQIVHRVKT